MPHVDVVWPGRNSRWPAWAVRSNTRRPSASTVESASGGIASRWVKSTSSMVLTCRPPTDSAIPHPLSTTMSPATTAHALVTEWSRRLLDVIAIPAFLDVIVIRPRYEAVGRTRTRPATDLGTEIRRCERGLRADGRWLTGRRCGGGDRDVVRASPY